MAGVVDFFVIAEANTTHQGTPKPRAFDAKRFAPFIRQLIYLPVVFPSKVCTEWSWVCENYQRDQLFRGFVAAGGRDDDVVMVSDADEVPNAQTVAALRGCDFESGLQHE